MDYVLYIPNPQCSFSNHFVYASCVIMLREGSWYVKIPKIVNQKTQKFCLRFRYVLNLKFVSWRVKPIYHHQRLLYFFSNPWWVVLFILNTTYFFLFDNNKDNNFSFEKCHIYILNLVLCIAYLFFPHHLITKREIIIRRRTLITTPMIQSFDASEFEVSELTLHCELLSA